MLRPFSDYIECAKEHVEVSENKEDKGEGGLPWWGIALIIFGVVVIVGGVATGGFALYRSKHADAELVTVS